ncbi:hypothetical protein AKJ46_00690 [candidate division MSBL1 archaeon SCGC-AAA833K04]|uniref:PLD phosphodiesterase domain-containing protein n=1 Tax=candidate division MSBL1 archaeon SCGC-AAA833K04 TaxID=1698258 RepID=A0A133VS28_9EURY|nr:hypothetical protein AKJ46_00690 [candidate division MSBL1 archaeon SCGC-AAA833K04]
MADEWTTALDSTLRDEPNVEVKEVDFDIHSKYFVIDNRIAFVGSQNWSNGGIQSNHELGVLIENKSVAGSYTYIFESGWSAAGGKNRGAKYWKTDWLYPAVSGPEMPPEPKTTVSALENLIDSANENVKIFNYIFTTGADPIANALTEAANRDVKIQLMVDAYYYENLFEDVWPEMSFCSYVDFSERLEELNSADGISVKGIHLGDWVASHQKVLVVDDKRMYVGSANLATKSMGTNPGYWRREVGVVIDNLTLGTALSESFDIYWNSEHSKGLDRGENEGIQINIYVVIVVASIIIAVIVVVWAWRTIRLRRTRKTQKWTRNPTHP